MVAKVQALLLDGKGAEKQVQFAPLDGGEAVTLTAKNVILAAGSVPIDIPVAPIDNDLSLIQPAH